MYTILLTLLVLIMGHWLYHTLQSTYTVPKIEKIYTIPEEHKHSP